MVLVPLFSVTVLVSIEVMVLSTVMVFGSWEKVMVLLPRVTICVDTMVWIAEELAKGCSDVTAEAAVEGSPVLINVLPDGAVEVMFWKGAAEVSGTGMMLPDGTNPVEGS